MPTVDVYADLLFLINAAMDGLCLLMTARLCHRPTRGWRLALAAAIGGLYAIPALLLPGAWWVSLGADMAVCVLMCAVSFGWRRLVSASTVCIALSMALGGVMTALCNLLGKWGLADSLTDGEDGIGAWLFLLVTLGSTVITLCGGRRLRRTVESRERGVTVTVTLGGHCVTLVGVVDTGNLLRDPLDGRAVICVDRDAVAACLSPSLVRIATAVAAGHIPSTDALTALPEASRLRLIPAQTAAGGSLLLALRPERITLAPTADTPCRLCRSATCEVDALIALIPSPVGDLQALVPATLWRG